MAKVISRLSNTCIPNSTELSGRYLSSKSDFSNKSSGFPIIARYAGEITIFSESEQNFNQKIAKVRHPMKVAEKIRFVMGRSMVRLGETEEGNVPTGRPQQYHRILPKERSACHPTSPPDFSP